MMAEKNKEMENKIIMKIILMSQVVFSSDLKLYLRMDGILRINNFKILAIKVTAEVVERISLEIEEKIINE